MRQLSDRVFPRSRARFVVLRWVPMPVFMPRATGTRRARRCFTTAMRLHLLSFGFVRVRSGSFGFVRVRSSSFEFVQWERMPRARHRDVLSHARSPAQG